LELFTCGVIGYLLPETAVEDFPMPNNCDRCNSSMVKEEIKLTGDDDKLVSLYHCTYCGRMEYLTADSFDGATING
jgi:hypothetical protein